MLDELAVQLQKPQVWLGLALTLLVAYALYRFGRTLLRALEPNMPRPLRVTLVWLWPAVIAVGWLSVATHVAYLPGVPVLFDLGSDILRGFRNSAGQVVVILALALIAWHLIGALSARIVAEEEFNRRSVRVQTLKGVVESTLKVALVVIGLIAGLQALGVDASSLLAGVSVLGLAVGFGAQSLIKDVFTGFFILLEDQYGVGDVITVNAGTLSGGVERVNLRVTALRALDGTLHIIPNGQIQTVSVSSKDWSRVVAAVEVSPAANIDDALRVLEAVGRELHADPEWGSFFLEEPEVQGVTGLTPDGVRLQALFKVQPKSQYALGREFNRRIKVAMDEAGIELPSGGRKLTLVGGPAEFRPLPGGAAQPDPRETQDRTRAPVRTGESRDPEEER